MTNSLDIRTLNFVIAGIVPLITHNGQLANHFNSHTKRLKSLTSIKSKKEENHLEIQRVEWEGGLYLNNKGEPCIPLDVLRATFTNGAKKSKHGPIFKAGVYFNSDGELIYDGPRTVEGLAERFSEFSDVRLVNVNGSKVLRTRPIYNDWKVKFSVDFDPSIIDEADVIAAVANAGRTVGMCEMRPTYGRFVIESVK